MIAADNQLQVHTENTTDNSTSTSDVTNFEIIFKCCRIPNNFPNWKSIGFLKLLFIKFKSEILCNFSLHYTKRANSMCYPKVSKMNETKRTQTAESYA